MTCKRGTLAAKSSRALPIPFSGRVSGTHDVPKESTMSFKITYCPVCGAEHSDSSEKLSEHEAVQLCLSFDELDGPDRVPLSTDSRADHCNYLSMV